MYVITDVPKDLLQILDSVINEKDLAPLNMDLAGNLKHEYSIPKDICRAPAGALQISLG